MRDWKQEVRVRLAGLEIPPARLVSIVDEVAQHLEERYTRLVAGGMAAEEADRAVLHDLSDSDVLTRDVQQIMQRAESDPVALGGGGGQSWADSIWQDVRYGCRTLRQSPGFTAVAAITLALGVGANTAIFTVANTVMLRPLPFAAPDRLVRLWESNPEKGWPTFSASYPTFLDWRRQSRTFERLAAQLSTGFTLASDSGAELVRANAVTADFLPLLGATPMLGRNFRAEEDRPGGRTNVAILTHAFWSRRFAASPSAVGKTLVLDGRAYDIIGVLPPTFAWGSSRLHLLVPLAPDPARARGDHRLVVIGRLAPGSSLEEARTEMTGIAAQIARQFPESNGGWTVRASSFYDWLVPQEARDSVRVLFGAVGLVLLIACGNVASLMLARVAAREKEISIRVALGAERRRVIRQLLIESAIVALIAAALGLMAAWGGTRLIAAAGPAAGLPRLDELSLDARVFFFALALAMCSAFVFGLAPALQASRPNVSDTLKEAGRTASSGRTKQRLRSTLVVVEMALSVALLIAAGLLVRSFERLQHVQPGFDLDHLITMRVNLPRLAYNTDDKSRSFYERLLPGIAALPGVRAVATSSGVPLAGGNTATELDVPGQAHTPGVPSSADWRLVSRGYFSTMGIPLRGRDFDETDVGTANRSASAVTIVSESMARRYWPNEDPIGKTVILRSFGPRPQTIIGVAGDVRSVGLDADVRPMVYGFAGVYAGWNPMSLVVRSAVEPTSHVAEIRNAIQAIDLSVPVFDVRTLPDLLSESFGPRRFNMYLLGCFAAIAAVLACVGVFGVLAYLVSQGTRDIGIRLALGATSRDVVRLIVGRGLLLTASGAALGLMAALASARVMQTLIFSVSPRDPATFVAVPLALVAVASIACYLPARRATRVDPLIALRSE